MLRKLKLLWNFMAGSRFLYILSVAGIGAATLISFSIPLIIKTTIDSFIGDRVIDLPLWCIRLIDIAGGAVVFRKNLWIACVLIVFFTILSGFFTFLTGKLTATASASTAENIRNRLYDHIQRLTYNYHVKAETGDLIQRCTSDVDTIRKFIGIQFAEIGRAVFMLAIALPIMFKLNKNLTIISIPVLPVLIGFSFIFFLKVQKAFKLSDEAEGRMSTVLQENITGVRVVRAFARQKHEILKFDRTNKEYRDLTYKLIRVIACYWSTADFLSTFQIGLIVVTGSLMAVNNMLSIGSLMVFITYVAMLLWPVRQMGRILSDMGKALVSLGRIEEILKIPREDNSGRCLSPKIKGGITFRNVSFHYDKDTPVIENVSFDITPGATVAILGATGCGKTSMLYLLVRLYEYTEGSIKIDGTELRDIDKHWIRKNIGFVLQEPFLFGRTIKENISFARKNAKEIEIFEASKTAFVHNVIENFDNGYDTAVGEKGVTLSGGQKQRVAIARALIQNTPILIFDDSLSAVDTETDASIRRALKNRKKRATTFIISHRLTTLAEADLILVMEKGKIVQTGDHDELVKRKGLYRRIWSIQNSLEEELNTEMEKKNE